MALQWEGGLGMDASGGWLMTVRCVETTNNGDRIKKRTEYISRMPLVIS